MSQNELNGTSVRPHVLCGLCRSFWARVTCLRFTPEELSGDNEQAPSMPEHLLHSPRRSEIKLSASLGCHFCSIIVGSLTGCTGDHSDRNVDENDPIYISIAVLNQGEGTFLLTLFSCEQREIISHDQILNNSPLRLCPSKNDINTATAPNELQSSMWQTSTYSEAATQFISAWIVECQTNHPLCGDDFLSLLQGLDQPLPPTRPRRVLDLQAFPSPERIQLVETENVLNLEYCALSYSWGFSKPYVMTSSNMMEFQREIPLNNLPKLLRDAIQFVRGIGFRYLWIDALCIMQDGHSSPAASDDWLDQAGKMNDIFGSSVVTIAASEAFDGNQSLIMTRDPLSHTTCRLNSDTKLSYEVVPSCTPYCMLHTFDNARYHLDTRAWVFQERILAPRTVHVTKNFMHLECRTELKCETISETANVCHHSGAVAKADYHTLFSMFSPGGGLEDFAVAPFLSFWHQLIGKYSTTNLSRPSDFLVALAGLAKQVQKQSGLTCSFGLWREHLLHDMLWYVRKGNGVPRRERAPSWSWASIELRQPPILYGASTDISLNLRQPQNPYGASTDISLNLRRPQILYEASTYVSLVAEIIALPDPSDFATRRPPFSAAEESRYAVKVAGPLLMTPLSTLRPGNNYTRIHRNCQGISHMHPKCPFHPDYELPDRIELCFLLIGRATTISATFAPGTTHRMTVASTFGEPWITEVGLALTPVAGRLSRRYRRVGYFHHDMQQREADSGMEARLPRSLFEGSQIQEVEIV